MRLLIKRIWNAFRKFLAFRLNLRDSIRLMLCLNWEIHIKFLLNLNWCSLRLRLRKVLQWWLKALRIRLLTLILLRSKLGLASPSLILLRNEALLELRVWEGRIGSLELLGFPRINVALEVLRHYVDHWVRRLIWAGLWMDPTLVWRLAHFSQIL